MKNLIKKMLIAIMLILETKIELSPTIIDYFENEELYTTAATTRTKKRRRQKNRNHNRYI
jgi:hypothetical protein